jgi:hypothetical protein
MNSHADGLGWKDGGRVYQWQNSWVDEWLHGLVDVWVD